MVLVLALRLEFLCDDAFITFRHVSNARDGHGLVWNAPPFRPVEGTTGFLWALLLWAVWSWFGIEPPDAANPLSIGFGLVTFAVTALAVLRLRRRDGAPIGLGVAWLALLVLATNRCFVQWMTGGLETALFDLGFVGWVLLAFRSADCRPDGRPDGRRGGWLAGWSAIAAATALTRPDGLLLVGATLATAVIALLQRRRTWRATVSGLSPLGLVLAQVVWRRWFYGEWLPNTYYAKVTQPWPEAGARYLYCFVFENGLWVWGFLAGAWLVAAALRRSLPVRALAGPLLPAVAATGAVVVHVAFYVLRVGGDHFEYRVFSYLPPLAVWSATAMLVQLTRRAWCATLGLVLLALAGGVAWLHFTLTRPAIPPDYDTLGDKLPRWLAPMVREFDRAQVWLQLQYDCARCNAHQRSLDLIDQLLPPRARMAPAPDDVPITQALSVGLVAWRLPDVAVIDLLGLSDWVVARTPTREWAASFLSKAALQQVLATADTDGDHVLARAELEQRLAAVLGCPPADAARMVGIWLFLFARARDDALTGTEADDVLHFFANLRWMAHERMAPPDYVAALDPNVTIADRRVVVRRRDPPLSPERLRAIEAEWRERVRQRRP